MKKALSTILFLSLVIVFGFASVNSIALVNALPDVHQGNLILSGNNVTIISGRFDINGSIIVEENATLILKNAIVNFTQSTSRQYNLTLRNPVSGNPHLLTYNSTIESDNPAFDVLTYAMANSTAEINNSTISSYLMGIDAARLIITNSSKVDVQYSYDSAHIEVDNSTIREWHNYYSPHVEVEDSTINNLLLGPHSVNCTIRGLKSGIINHWNFISNCSVAILTGGSSPNVSLTNTTVNNWRLAFYQNSNAFVVDSEVGEVSAIAGSSNINVKSSEIVSLYADNAATVQADNSTIGTLTTYESARASLAHSSVNDVSAQGSSQVWLNNTSASSVEIYDSSRTWLLNSIYVSLIPYDSGTACIAWYLSVHVVDLIVQDIPSANITARFENSTIAATAMTDANGRATLALAEKTINITAEYQLANYTVTAVYETYTNQTTINMTANRQVSFTLGFIVPEFQSSIMAFALMSTELLTLAIAGRRCRKRKHTRALS